MEGENMNELIYVAVDDKEICKLIKAHIENEGYRVEVFQNGQELLYRFAVQPCDMIITDIAMPHMNGYDLCREIRKTSVIPIFMISANNDEIDRVLGLELGSDDYIAKPIGFRELAIKIRNTFKRIERYRAPQTCEKDVLRCKDLSLHVVNREVKIGDERLPTTAKEFDLLMLFLSNRNVAFSREKMIERIWGYDYCGDSRQVDHMIKRLRKKMILAGAQCQIQTVWGYGYKIGDTNEA